MEPLKCLSLSKYAHANYTRTDALFPPNFTTKDPKMEIMIPRSRNEETYAVILSVKWSKNFWGGYLRILAIKVTKQRQVLKLVTTIQTLLQPNSINTPY